MLSSNTNKLTWVGIAVGVVGLIGASTMVMFPSAMDTAKTTLVQTVNHFTGNETEKPVAQDEKTYTNLSFSYDDDTQTANVSKKYGISDYSNIDIVIPETVKHNDKTYTVTGIDDFSKLTIKSISFPKTITKIGSMAFYKATIKSGDLNLPDSVQSISDSAFNGLSGVNTFTIPNSVTSIDDSAFNNSDIASINIGSGLSRIPTYAFANMKNLTSISIPSNVKTIDDHAFYGDMVLQSVILHEGLIEIQEYAFYQVPITSLYVPNSVTKLGFEIAYRSDNTPINISVPASIYQQSINNLASMPTSNLQSR